jgi:ATP-dependent DNA helicase RecG
MFQRAELVEKIGSGILRIRQLMKSSQLSDPLFKANGFFSISFERPRSEPINEPVNEPVNEIMIQISKHHHPNLKVLEAAKSTSY